MSMTDRSTLARTLRTLWRDEEEGQTQESFEYVKRNTALLEYLGYVGNEGFSVQITTALKQYEGSISFIGKDYFSITQQNQMKSISTSTFPILNTNYFIISIGKKTKNIVEAHCVPIENISFNSFINETSLLNLNCDIELLNQEFALGQIEIFKDFLKIVPKHYLKDRSDSVKEFITSHTQLICKKSIIAVSTVSS